MRRLAKALGVSREVLTGQEPLPETSAAHKMEKAATTVRLSAITQLHYDLISVTLGISRDELVQAAPLLFMLLADASLHWRRQRLEHCVEAFVQSLERSWITGTESPNLGSSDPDSPLNCEHRSIRSRDVFGTAFDDPIEHEGVNQPFSDYLLHQFGRAATEGFVALARHPAAEEYEWLPTHFTDHRSKFPEFTILEDELVKITNGNIKARHALESGAVRISAIPADLLPAEKASERAAWLAERALESKQGEGK